MRYLNSQDIGRIGIPWNDVIGVIEHVSTLLKDNDYSQPIKPYLRFNDLKNRIIAMPAYVGGTIGTAGIKWIASFPGNIGTGIPRAHSVVLLNDARTGYPYCTINTSLLSGIRTSAVSGYVIGNYLSAWRAAGRKFAFGVIGVGPIGLLHVRMLLENFSENVEKIFLYDIKGIAEDLLRDHIESGIIEICDRWETVFQNSDVFITCTTSSFRYIDLPAKKGALYLNVSLRDFKESFLTSISRMIVDDWDEVCRENTDIEVAHNALGLQREDVYRLGDVESLIRSIDLPSESLLFNPMGMAIFDIGIAKFYYELALQTNVGVELED